MSHREQTTTARLLEIMRRDGPKTARQLASMVGLADSGRVSALLAARRRSGEVELVGGHWLINPDWDDCVASELRDARILLERAGYLVTMPAS